MGAIVGATLGLLAFMLAFTFGLAASRFDELLVLDESNAIGTAYLRAGLLPEPQRSGLRKLLKDYVELRLNGIGIKNIEQALSESSGLHRALWSLATEVAAKDTRSVETGLFIQSLNEVIDLHSKRVMFGLHNRIPQMVWMRSTSLRRSRWGRLDTRKE